MRVVSKGDILHGMSGLFFGQCRIGISGCRLLKFSRHAKSQICPARLHKNGLNVEGVIVHFLTVRPT